MIQAPFTGSLQTAVQVQTGSGQWANGIRLLNKAAPAANRIVPFVRPVAPLIKGALLGKAALLVGAFAVGFAIGTYLRKIPGLLDPAGPLPKKVQQVDQPLVEQTDVYFDGETVRKVQINAYVQVFKPASIRCDSGDKLSNASSSERTCNANFSAKAFRIVQQAARELRVCGTGPDTRETIECLRLEYKSGNNPDWRVKERAVGSNGQVELTVFGEGGQPTTYDPVVTSVLVDELPERPKPYKPLLPQVEPLPEVETETAPKRILPPAPVIAPPLTVPGEPVPQPETEPGKAPVKTPIKAPPTVKPPTAPAVKPATKPATTTDTTASGEIVKSAPKTATATNKSDHFLGKNAGGRISGRTASKNPTQVAQEVARIEQKTAKTQKGDFNGLDLAGILALLRLIWELLNSQTAGTTYKLQGVCECPPDAQDCEEPELTAEIPSMGNHQALVERLDAIAAMFQPLKTWKQPICNEKPQLAGDFRTISFISTERTTAGDRYLSKRFRYRSQSGADLATLVDHWKDFQWDAGPVCVQHSGHSWGTPQVWAASVDEGKRVILHAGREAGVDPDQVGQWTVSGSNNPRFGLSGRMRVNTKGGYYWITERLGSSERPLVLGLGPLDP